MTAAIIHRGPDDEGYWTDGAAGVALGHRRLAVIDLSPQGHQPMVSADGRLVISFNGEIYNHAAIRARLEDEGFAPQGGWRGRSDTETLLQAIAAWGLEESVAQAVGMFALALWDRDTRTLSLVRDRFGEKPLYYGWVGGDFLFASELKAIRAHPRFDGQIDRVALRDFMARGHVPGPRSIYRGLFKLSPGCILTISPTAAAAPRAEPLAEGAEEGGLRLTRYWDYREVVEAGLADPLRDEAQALNSLEAALADAVAGQSVADVPVGAFLSGGIDSATIVALAQKYTSRPVRTYSIGFEEAGFDEAPHARAVAAHLGTIHHEHYVSASEARDVIPMLGQIYDEPFADSSQIPTFLVSRFARGEVTVALTGDGGDELFGGYNRHTIAPAMWRKASRLPRSLRQLGAGAVAKLPDALLRSGGPHFADKLKRGARLVGSARGFEDLYAGLRDEWHGAPTPVLGAFGQGSFDLGLAAPDTVRAMYADAVTYLPDDILCKVDRASMAVSLETRVPFLDHRVAAVAARIPLAMKIDRGEGKRILRTLLYREAPRALFDRPKAGFAVPVGEWLKGPLKPWADALLDPARLAADGMFDPGAITRRWREHVAGTRDWTSSLWAALMFNAWLDSQR
jgi:asparagine synthase (glutamine-hydrolysing)